MAIDDFRYPHLPPKDAQPVYWPVSNQTPDAKAGWNQSAVQVHGDTYLQSRNHDFYEQFSLLAFDSNEVIPLVVNTGKQSEISVRQIL